MERRAVAEEEALAFLREDPIRYTGPIGRIAEEEWRVKVAGDPVEGVLLMGPPRDPKRQRIVLATRSPGAARELLTSLPSAEYSASLTDMDLLAALERDFPVTEKDNAWLFHLPAEGLVPHGDVPYRPVPASYAPLIASTWDPDRLPDSVDYIRKRLERGPSVGLWLDGDLVGWYGNHTIPDSTVNTGFLHVREPHRGKGWGKALATALCRHILTVGKIPVCHVEVGNEPSLALHRAVGFKENCMQGWAGIVVPPH
jgi:GNAT superfamily N-acetyltransferase